MQSIRGGMVQVADLLRSNCISWSPQAKSPRRRFQPPKDEKRSFESRRKHETSGECPELSNFSCRKVLAIERSGPLRAEISCRARSAHRRWTTTRAEPLTREECNAFFRIKADQKGRGFEHNSNKPPVPDGIFSSRENSLIPPLSAGSGTSERG